MTAYNINKLIGQDKVNALKHYLDTCKITVCYSDTFNVFAVRTYKKDTSSYKKQVAMKYIKRLLKDTPINTLIEYPKMGKKKD